MSKITSILKPTAARTELANELTANVAVLRHLRDLLFTEKKRTPDAVRRSVEGYLARRLARAPRRGKGARKRRFLERCIATAKRARRGLYVCYAVDGVDHTSNFIENLNGRVKHHQRRVGGRASTAGGQFESYGEALVPLVLETKLKGGLSDLRERVANVSTADYKAARKELDALQEPARERRSAARKPEEFLAKIVERVNAALTFSESR